jgi:hypothetical protein
VAAVPSGLSLTPLRILKKKKKKRNYLAAQNGSRDGEYYAIRDVVIYVSQGHAIGLLLAVSWLCSSEGSDNKGILNYDW